MWAAKLERWVETARGTAGVAWFRTGIGLNVAGAFIGGVQKPEHATRHRLALGSLDLDSCQELGLRRIRYERQLG